MSEELAAKIQLEDFLDRKMMLIERLARQCPTLGDFHDLVIDRYAAFGGEVAAIASETPSVERYERICRVLADALLLSLRFQDTSVLFSPHLQTAFDLVCERPKTPPPGIPIVPESFLFSAAEADRVVTAAVGVYRAFALLMTEMFGESCPLELKIIDTPALAAVRAQPSEERPMAVLFVSAGGGRWRFTNDILMLLQPVLMRKAHVFDDWERQGQLIGRIPLKALTTRAEMRDFLNVAGPAMDEAARRCNANAIDAHLLSGGAVRLMREGTASPRPIPSTPSAVDVAEPEVPIKTREVGRFTVDEYKHRVVYTDHDHAKFEPYSFNRKKTKRGISAFEAVWSLVNDYKAGMEQTRNSAKWKGAFQSGKDRGDAHRFAEEQVFRLPRWSKEKGRFILGQYEGKWRLWTDDEMKLSTEKRLRHFIEAHPNGLPRRY